MRWGLALLFQGNKDRANAVLACPANTTCTATEVVPSGYSSNQAGCANVALTPTGTASCTIINTLNSATFTVNKDFVPNDAASVNVSLVCGAGTVTPGNPQTVTEARTEVNTYKLQSRISSWSWT